MKELDQLVENFLQPKKKGLSMNQLIELIEEVIEATKPLAEEEQTGKEVTPDININLPAIRITEDFGRIGTKIEKSLRLILKTFKAQL